ncbi:hypothetical protein AZA_48467 [Nitrospirillum viridazoti Y2]|uniref:Tetratricopeptide repeat protein n=1 Tax=Nitrospirillum amazonense TaxID=28077 RepID=A0A560ISW8_9PROT|nr:hypothetical protein [Nitrospirillum amazonense]EGY02114.1 hypothetical protein AZA_48467 [Nitrospirillum amazonense Y2]TWB62162.1 hypothetical protein FBZ92_10597 [Nitrospirillum amazonense]
MIATHFLRAALLASALTMGGAVVISAPTPAHAADAAKKFSPEVGKPLQAAQEALKAKKYKEALDKLEEADKASKKSAYETYTIETLRASAYSGAGDMANFAKSLEATLATGQVPDADKVNRDKLIAEAYFSVKNYAKFSAASDRYYKDGGTDNRLKELAIQIYLDQKDYANASKAARAMIQAQGGKPSKTLLQTVASAEYNMDHKAAFLDAMERILVNYPDQESWESVIRGVQKLPGFNSNRLQIDVLRLQIGAGLVKDPGPYLEFAQLAMSDGLGTEAKAVMDKGFKAGILGKAQGDREKRLADMAGKQVDDDQRKLPDDEKEAAAQPDGKQLVKVGTQYLALGNAAKAIEVIQAGIKKDQLKYPEEAKLRLVQAYLAAGQKPKALDAMKSIKGTDGTADIARLYLIQAGISPF